MNNVTFTRYLYGSRVMLTISGKPKDVARTANRLYNIGAVSLRHEEPETEGTPRITVTTTPDRLKKGLAALLVHRHEPIKRITKSMEREAYLAYVDKVVSNQMEKIVEVEPMKRQRTVTFAAPSSFETEDPERENITQEIFG